MNFLKRWLHGFKNGFMEFWKIMNDPRFLDFLSSPESIGIQRKNEPPS